MLSYLWKRTSRVTCVTLVLWVGNETLRLLPSSSRCRQDSFRQRNLRSGWRVRQYDLTTSLRQRRRRAISQWIGVILYGFSDSVRSGRSRSVQRSVSFPTQRTRVTQVTRDVFMSNIQEKLQKHPLNHGKMRITVEQFKLFCLVSDWLWLSSHSNILFSAFYSVLY